MENRESLVIPARYNGPPGSANGGYACGLVAALLGGQAEVTLRSPPPLELELAVERGEAGARVRDGETLVAEAVRLADELELEDVPPPVSVEEAERASRDYAGFREHAYATCFVCGPEREDGLGIYPGPVAGQEVVAAPWRPPPGRVADELVWAALDCPSGWAIDQFARRGVLLGRLAARLLAPLEGGSAYVTVGWPRGEEGRKRFAGSALFGGDGRLCAYARSTWLVPRTV